MADDIDNTSKWLHISGIDDGGKRLTLQADRVHVSGRLGIGTPDPRATLHVNGDLRVEGDQNLLKVFEQTLVVKNAGNGPAGWGVEHPGMFSKIYTAFAVFQGYGLAVPTTDVNAFASDANPVRWADARAISQHMYVRVTSSTTDATKGTAYVAEANRDYESDNAVLLTVVVLGRP